jgi:hypothetical protein
MYFTIHNDAIKLELFTSNILAISLTKSLFLVTHTLSISKALMGYRFGATYVGEKHVGPGEAFPGEYSFFV